MMPVDQRIWGLKIANLLISLILEMLPTCNLDWLTEYLMILKSQNPWNEKFYAVQKRGSRDFRALKFRNVWWGSN